ncbi:FliI/YscN family ATPase [Acidocella sp. KAb 2-4]|uniref:FliI/YscN family ATPase n=1 Tax=Acidocella sp. KAb 2-4 TaxID=2885158 RepID=UPI001D076FBE|nr:FliI/YscN family ATPase [Acidocella sp. KAb 2-4]MCB5945695.1 FliI/YscN family ATPase [Acidocella sp. KAb 2-4]
MINIEAVRAQARERVRAALAVDPVRRFGRIVRASGDVLHASGIRAPIGARCLIDMPDAAPLPAEIVGFQEGGLLLMPEQGARGVVRGARVHVEGGTHAPLVGPELLGRVLDARGAPLDGLPPPAVSHPWPLMGVSVNPMTRARLDQPFDVGVRAINALATFGRGMRVGLFAGSGVGKTTLLGMLSRHAQADVVVVAMIGERGREIREFIEDHLGHARQRSVVVASPADDTALSRVHGAYRAAAIAEYFRAQGQHVLLVVDSLTRLAMAQREIGLAVGEPPATKGYPPSVFGALAAYVERAGNGAEGQGSITAIYTVLVEGDDHVGDPVGDTARSVLDGHIVLSRAMVEAAIYPPIDITASLSRPMPGLVPPEHMALASRFRALWARKREKQDFIDLGAYAPGRDKLLDEAIQRAPAMEALLRQDKESGVTLAESVAALRAALGEAA